MGDPSERFLAVYTPPSGRTEGRPLILELPGFTGTGSTAGGPPRFLEEGVLRLYDRLVRSQRAPEAVVIAVDGLTSLGGSQYVDSTATGPYARYVAEEIVDWARSQLGVGPVGLVGQSSGGFGALHLAFEYPGRFGAVGVSAGDMGFDRTFPPDILRALKAFERFGGVEPFLEALFADPNLLRGPTDPIGSALLVTAMSACYSPRPDEPGAFDLPFDLRTGELDPTLWAKWLRFDPLRRVASAAGRDALKRLRGLFLATPTEDEWFLDLEARRFSAALTAGGVPHELREFPGGHFQATPRFEWLLPSVATALGTAAE